MQDSDDEPKIKIAAPVLEEPPAAHTEDSGIAGLLFGDASAVALGARAAAGELLLGLLTRDLDFNEFMREALMVVMRTIRSEAGSILEADPKNECFVFRTAVGRSSDQLAKFTVPLTHGIAGQVYQSRRMVLVSNVQENSIHLRAIEKAVGFEARNLVAVPLMVRGNVFGVLELLNRATDEGYTDGDLETLEKVCGMLARAIEIRLMIGWALQRAKTQAAS